MWQLIKKSDWVLTVTVLILCSIGLLELWGLSLNASQESGTFFIKQLIFVGIGIIAMLVLGLADARIYKNNSLFLIMVYFISLAALIAVLILGSKIRGMTGWFRIGELGFAPVELAKIILILILAKYFSARHVEVYRARHIIISGLYMAIPAVLVLRQPDLGSALILVSIWLGTVLLSGMKQRHLLIVLFIGFLTATLAWNFALKPYQKERMLTFLNPAKDPLGYSYNLIQSKIAVGSGGLWGKGLGQGSQGQLNFLPEKHTDFIFAVFAEEWGFAGVLFLFGTYLLFFYRLIKIIFICSNNFFRLFVAGFAVMVFAQISINVGMSLGIMPITGIALPFLSYGGSNLLINFMALGIVQNIAMQSKSSVGSLSFEI